MNRRALACAALVTLASTSWTQSWSRFRGPNGSGVSTAERLPTDFSEEGILWRTELPPGHSSPVVWKERVFLTGIEDEGLYTFCIDGTTGEVLWRQEAPRPRQDPIDNRNNPASPSPVVDADVVVVFFPEFGMLAYDHEGEELWSVPLKPFQNLYGMGPRAATARRSCITPPRATRS